MSTLLRLYPRAWRDRYGDELVALLEEHPATFSDLLDLIRAALDARLHPQVSGSAVGPGKEISVNQRLLAVMAAIGGIAWIAGVASTYLLPFNIYGERDTSLAVWGVAVGGSLIGISLGELSTRAGSISWTGHAIAVSTVILSLTLLLGWPWMVLGFVGIPLMMMLGAARAYATDRLPGWGVAALGVASVAALAGVFSFSGGPLYGAIGVGAMVLAVVAFRSEMGAVPAAPAGPTEEPA